MNICFIFFLKKKNRCLDRIKWKRRKRIAGEGRRLELTDAQSELDGSVTWVQLQRCLQSAFDCRNAKLLDLYRFRIGRVQTKTF